MPYYCEHCKEYIFQPRDEMVVRKFECPICGRRVMEACKCLMCEDEHLHEAK